MTRSFIMYSPAPPTRKRYSALQAVPAASGSWHDANGSFRPLAVIAIGSFQCAAVLSGETIAPVWSGVTVHVDVRVQGRWNSSLQSLKTYGFHDLDLINTQKIIRCDTITKGA